MSPARGGMRRIRIAERGNEGPEEVQESDLKAIAQAIDLSILNWSIRLTAEGLGFEIDPSQENKIWGFVQERLKELERQDQLELDQKFEEAIREIVPVCRICRNEIIEAKITHHSHISGEFPMHSFVSWAEIDFLYCTGCGCTYYNNRVAELSSRYNKGEFRAKERFQRSNFC